MKHAATAFTKCIVLPVTDGKVALAAIGPKSRMTLATEGKSLLAVFEMLASLQGDALGGGRGGRCTTLAVGLDIGRCLRSTRACGERAWSLDDDDDHRRECQECQRELSMRLKVRTLFLK